LKTSTQPIRKMGKRNFITWTDERDLCLLELCVINGIHKKMSYGKELSSTQKREKWTRIQSEFYMQDMNIGLQKPQTTRKLRDRYYWLVKSVTDKNGWGENNGTHQKVDGDFGLLDAIVKNILMEAEEGSEDEKDVDVPRKLMWDLERTEANMWYNLDFNAMGVKSAEEDSIDRSDRKKARIAKLEEQISEVLLQVAPQNERATEKLMLAYIDSNNIGYQKFLEICGIFSNGEGDETASKVRELSIGVLVNMYCAPTQKFAPTQFKADLKSDIGIKALDVHKIYWGLSEIREWASNANLLLER